MSEMSLSSLCTFQHGSPMLHDFQAFQCCRYFFATAHFPLFSFSLCLEYWSVGWGLLWCGHQKNKYATAMLSDAILFLWRWVPGLVRDRVHRADRNKGGPSGRLCRCCVNSRSKWGVNCFTKSGDQWVCRAQYTHNQHNNKLNNIIAGS